MIKSIHYTLLLLSLSIVQQILYIFQGERYRETIHGINSLFGLLLPYCAFHVSILQGQEVESNTLANKFS